MIQCLPLFPKANIFPARSMRRNLSLTLSFVVPSLHVHTIIIITMFNILLLRESTPGSAGPDRYESAFSSAGYNPLSVPVLETMHTNILEMRDLLIKGPIENELEGVIVTSKRSCEAWREVLHLLKDSDADKSGVEEWSKIPFYVVGLFTSTALRDIFSEFNLPLPDVRGQDSGSAAALAPFILQDLKDHSKANSRLLYLTGDKNRDTLPRILKEGGIELEEVQVYKTQGSPAFEGNLEAVLASSPSGDSKPWWIVYFAPSAAAFVTPTLRKHFLLSTSTSSPNAAITGALRQAKIAAIGPTTNSFLLDELKLRVHAMAPKSTPQEIVGVITQYDSQIQ